MYEITTQAKFQPYLEVTALEYRFLIGKHINNFNLSTIFKGKRVHFYNGERQQPTKEFGIEYYIDLRQDFIYAVYRA